MCGMVGSRQGWAEAGYLPVPAHLDEIAARAVRVPSADSATSAFCRVSARPTGSFPDVMRGEETQLLGLARREAGAAGTRSKIVCMPGTHSKWVHGRTGLHRRGFREFHHRRHVRSACRRIRSCVTRLASPGRSMPESERIPRLPCEASLDSPADILSQAVLRSARRGFLQGLVGRSGAGARLSGYLIGQEIAGAPFRGFPLAKRSNLSAAGAHWARLYHGSFGGCRYRLQSFMMATNLSFTASRTLLQDIWSSAAMRQSEHEAH